MDKSRIKELATNLKSLDAPFNDLVRRKHDGEVGLEDEIEANIQAALGASEQIRAATRPNWLEAFVMRFSRSRRARPY